MLSPILCFFGEKLYTRFNFLFQCPVFGGQRTRTRKLTFLTADITTPATYPALLKSKLKEGFDIFYMKGALAAPKSYPQFLPHLAKSMNPGSWLMTADKTAQMEAVNPEQSLRVHDLNFALHKQEEPRLLEELMYECYTL